MRIEEHKAGTSVSSVVNGLDRYSSSSLPVSSATRATL